MGIYNIGMIIFHFGRIIIDTELFQETKLRK